MIRNRFFLYSFLGGMILLAAAIGGFYGLKSYTLSLTGPSTDTQYLYIKPGSGLIRVASEARKAGLVDADWHLSFAARSLGVERLLKAGEYEVEPDTTVESLLNKLVDGETYARRIVVPEGYSILELERLLQTSFGLDNSGLVLPAEGSILPNTYFYNRGETGNALIRRMQDAMQKAISEAWDGRAAGLPLSNPDQAITLASIVEKETGLAEERELVAAVFINRLNIGMRLQSDPTIIYGVTGGLPLGRPIRRSEKKEKTAYNTYRIDGLPPTPIANPGVEAIAAVLNPAKVPFLYFVADGSGGHAFAKTLKEHNANVRRWRKLQQEAKSDNLSSK